MAPLVSKYLDKQIRGAVDHGRMALEIWRSVDETSKLGAGDNTLEIAFNSLIQPRHKIERAKAGSLITVFRRDILTNDADIMLNAVDPGDLARYKNEISDKPVRNVVS